MIRQVITKSGVTVDIATTTETDYNDACSLLGSEVWKRYFERKLLARKDSLRKELETLQADSALPYRLLQARIQEIDEIINIPANDVRNLGR